MKNSLLAGAAVCLLAGCHGAEVTRFTPGAYPPTQRIEVFSDPSLITHPYIEIGYVEAKGGLGVSKQDLLNDMKEEAMAEGANALIKVDFYDRERYDRYIGGYSKPAAKAVMIRYTDKPAAEIDSAKYFGSALDGFYHRRQCPNYPDPKGGKLESFTSQVKAQDAGYKPCPDCILKAPN